MKYRTREGDVLDEICWRYYGSESAVKAVLEANPRLADLGAVLPSGVLLELPDIPRPDRRIDTVRLWD